MLVDCAAILYIRIIAFATQMQKLNDKVTVLDAICVLCRSYLFSHFLVD